MRVEPASLLRVMPFLNHQFHNRSGRCFDGKTRKTDDLFFELERRLEPSSAAASPVTPMLRLLGISRLAPRRP